MKTFTNTHTLLYHTNDSISIPLRYSIIEGTTWFIGKDVAAICGYKDTWRAIKYHVSPENTDHTIFNSRKLIIINYAGFKEIDPTEEHLNWFINHLPEADSSTEAPTVFTHPQFGTVRTVEISGEPWFVGKDVATALGYANPSNAVSVHVDKEDKTSYLIQVSGSNYKANTALINESGLYALILSSKLPSAKEFKHWVTSEVLPSIRKNGAYIRNQENMTPAEIVARGLIAAQKIIEEREKEIALLNGRCGLLTQVVDEKQETIENSSESTKSRRVFLSILALYNTIYYSA